MLFRSLHTVSENHYAIFRRLATGGQREGGNTSTSFTVSDTKAECCETLPHGLARMWTVDNYSLTLAITVWNKVLLSIIVCRYSVKYDRSLSSTSCCFLQFIGHNKMSTCLWTMPFCFTGECGKLNAIGNGLQAYPWCRLFSSTLTYSAEAWITTRCWLCILPGRLVIRNVSCEEETTQW